MSTPHKSDRLSPPICAACEEEFSPLRAELGYDLCLSCGDKQAVRERASWCVLTPHKQGAMFFTAESAIDLAKGINSKYTPV